MPPKHCSTVFLTTVAALSLVLCSMQAGAAGAATATTESAKPAKSTRLAEKPTARLCYFSFNTDAEFKTVSRFADKLNKHAPVRIEVVELQPYDEDPEDAIKAAVKSGVHCDGVVLSGHHRRKFWGDRSSGSIKAKYYDQLSCRNESAEWFMRPKAVWLEGCNTGRQELLNSKVKPKYRIDGNPFPLIQAKLELDDLEDSIDDINDILEENLNEDNIAVDYLRIFPAATLYTWTAKAPGEKAGSEHSLLYHVAQVSRLVDPNPALYQDPRGPLEPATAARYGEVLYSMLTGVPLGPKTLNEGTYIKGWHAHGDYKQKFAYDNHELKGFPALLYSDAEILRQNRGMRCLLRNYKGKDTPQAFADYIVRHGHLAPFNNYLALALIKSTEGQPELQQSLVRSFSQSGPLRAYLRQAVEGSNIASYQRDDAKGLLKTLRDVSPALADVEVEPAGTGQ